MLELQYIFILKGDAPYLPRFPELMTVIRREWLVQKRQIRIWWRLSLYIVFTVALWVHGFLPWYNGLYYYYLLLALALALMLPPISGSIARERETGSLDMLLLTPLRSSELLAGKLIAACLPVLSVILLSTLAMAVILTVTNLREGMSFIYFLEPLHFPLTLFTEIVFCCFLALFCSTLFRSSMRALATVMSILAVAFLLPIVLSHFIFFLNRQWAYFLIRPIVIISLLAPAIIMATGTTALCVKNHNRLKSKSLPWPIHFLLMVVLTIVYLVLFFIVWNHQQPFTHYLVNYFGPPDYLFMGGFMGSYFGPADGNILQRLLVKFIVLNVVGTATLFSFSVDRLELLRRR